LHLHSRTKILDAGEVTRLARKQKAIYGNGETRCKGSSCGSTYVGEPSNHFGSDFYDSRW